MWLIGFSLIVAGRQQCLHYTLRVLKGVIFTRFFFLTVYISVYPDFCCCRHLQDLCKIWAPDKRYRNEQTLMNDLPLTCQPALPFSLSSHHAPAWLAPEGRKGCCAPRGAVSLHLLPNTWSMRADLKQDQALLNISFWQFAWKKTSLHDFSGFHQTLAKIHRYLQLLLLSKL